MTARDAFDRRLSKIEALFAPPLPDDLGPEAAWRRTLTEEQLEAENLRQAALIENATHEELDGLILAFSIHPRDRGEYLLWPPSGLSLLPPHRS